MEAYEDLYTQGRSIDPVFFCCLCVALALGARKEGNEATSKELFTMGWNLYGRVISTPYLPSVQALLLIVSHEYPKVYFKLHFY